MQLFLFQLVDQVEQVEVSAPLAVSDGLPGYCYGQVRLAGAGTTDQYDVALVGKAADSASAILSESLLYTRSPQDGATRKAPTDPSWNQNSRGRHPGIRKEHDGRRAS